MTGKPTWLTTEIKLKIAVALIAAGLFVPVYTVVENTIGKDRAKELLDWGMSAKEEAERPAEGKPPVVVPAPEPTVDTIPQRVDDLDISGGTVRVCSNSSHNRFDPLSITPTHTIKSARIEGGNVRLSYDVPSSYWASTTDHMKFARGQVYWKDGDKVVGGHFDWFRPGQTVKTTGNIYNGYLTRKPPSGATLYFVIMSNDGKQRTNLKAASK